MLPVYFLGDSPGQQGYRRCSTEGNGHVIGQRVSNTTKSFGTYGVLLPSPLFLFFSLYKRFRKEGGKRGSNGVGSVTVSRNTSDIPVNTRKAVGSVQNGKVAQRGRQEGKNHGNF